MILVSNKIKHENQSEEKQGVEPDFLVMTAKLLYQTGAKKFSLNYIFAGHHETDQR